MTLVVDSSALVAIVFREPDWSAYFEALVVAETSYLSCMNLHEARIAILRRLGEAGVEQLHELISSQTIRFVSFDEAQAQVAFAAYVQFGKGRHPARLNLGDCAAYALAKSRDAPLLFKGDDFRLTDVTPAL